MKCSKCNRSFESARKLREHQKKCRVQVTAPVVVPTPTPMPVVTTPVVTTGTSTVSGLSGGQPRWDVLRNFNSGVAGANAQYKPDAFDDAAGASVYSSERSFEGGMSAKLSITAGTDGWGSWGGVINFPSALATGSDLWLQLYVFMPSDFVISTPTNGSLKFIRIKTKSADGVNAGYNDVQFQDDANQVSAFRMIKEGQDWWFNFGTANSFTKGTWHRVTVNLKIGSVPKASGGFSRTRVWQNGALLIDESRMQTLSSETDLAEALYLFTYWNGNAPRTQSLWVDEIRMTNYQPTWASDLQGVSSATI